MFIFPTKGSVI